MTEPRPRLPVTPGQLTLACAVLAILCTITNLKLLRSGLGWANAASVVFGLILVLAASGTGSWVALRTLRATAAGSTARKVAVAGLIANLLPVMFLTLAWTVVSRVSDRPQRPLMHADRRTEKSKSERGHRRGPEPVRSGGGLITASRVRSSIHELEQVLYDEGPSTLAAVGRVYRRSDNLAAALRRMQTMSETSPELVSPDAVPNLKRAETAVAAFRNHVTHRLIVWTDASSLPGLRARWEQVRDRCFTPASWMRQGSPELDRAQSVRKPDVDSDLMRELNSLQNLVADLESREEFDWEWVSYVTDVLHSTRVWHSRRDVAESMRSRKHKGWKTAVDLGPDGPRELMDAYTRMRSVCEWFFYVLPTPHWITESYQMRLARSSRRALDDAWDDLQELQYPHP